MDCELVRFPKSLGGYSEQRRETSGFALYFASIMMDDRRFEGARLLDIGCGARGPLIRDRFGNAVFPPVLSRARQIDGLDPGYDLKDHTALTQRWQSTLEDAPLEPNAYEVMVSFNVLEHVATPVKFLAAAYRALKPGGVFYAMTPHGQHPFAVGVKIVEVTKAKYAIADKASDQRINHIPTHYRLNTRAAILTAAERAGFTRASLFRAPCVNWDSYFVPGTKFVPHLFDRVIGSRSNRFAQQLLVRLEK